MCFPRVQGWKQSSTEYIESQIILNVISEKITNVLVLLSNCVAQRLISVESGDSELFP